MLTWGKGGGIYGKNKKSKLLVKVYKYTAILVKYLGGISKEAGVIQKQLQDIFTFSSLASEDVFAVSLHQMTDKCCIILCD